jgi:hypothetical protein
MTIAFLTSTPPAATKNDRRISFISHDLASTDTWGYPPKWSHCQEAKSS